MLVDFQDYALLSSQPFVLAAFTMVFADLRCRRLGDVELFARRRG